MRGMSTVRTAENADKIVAGISDGVPLRQLCRDLQISKSEVYRWRDDDAEFEGRIARARLEGFDAIADETIEIVDNLTEDPASRRVRADTRLKLLAKWDPKRYGDKQLIGSDPDNPLPAGFEVKLVGGTK